MCIPLIARVLDVENGIARVELTGGEEANANTTLHPDVNVNDYVLLDRGLIVDVIDEAEAESLLSLYEELNNLWDDELVRYE